MRLTRVARSMLTALFTLASLAQEPAPLDPALVDACGETPGWACESVLDATDNEALAKAVDFLVARPLKIILIIAVAFVLNRLVRRAVRRFVTQMEQGGGGRLSALRARTPSMLLATGPVNLRSAARAQTLAAVLRSVSTAVIYGIAAIYVFAELGLQLGPLIAGAGVVGVALGFGAQSLVRDFLSGIFMLIEDQYGVGDIIDVGEASGTVEAVTLRSTRLRDVEGTVWHVPNGQIMRVGNLSQQWARALLDIEVAYGSDVRQAQRVIKEVADTVWRSDDFSLEVLEEPEVWGVENLAADGIAIRLVVKTRPSSQFKVMRELRIRVKEAFDEAGIEIPFPQRTLWVRHDDGAGGEFPPRPGGDAGDARDDGAVGPERPARKRPLKPRGG
ncbi:mechanosensitive ion channel [soil metagenome]